MINLHIESTNSLLLQNVDDASVHPTASRTQTPLTASVRIDKILLIPMLLSVLLVGPTLYQFPISFLCGKKSACTGSLPTSQLFHYHHCLSIALFTCAQFLQSDQNLERLEIPTSLFRWTLHKVIWSWCAFTCIKCLIRTNHFDMCRVL